MTNPQLTPSSKCAFVSPAPCKAVGARHSTYAGAVSLRKHSGFANQLQRSSKIVRNPSVAHTVAAADSPALQVTYEVIANSIQNDGSNPFNKYAEYRLNAWIENSSQGNDRVKCNPYPMKADVKDNQTGINQELFNVTLTVPGSRNDSYEGYLEMYESDVFSDDPVLKVPIAFNSWNMNKQGAYDNGGGDAGMWKASFAWIGEEVKERGPPTPSVPKTDSTGLFPVHLGLLHLQLDLPLC